MRDRSHRRRRRNAPREGRETGSDRGFGRESPEPPIAKKFMRDVALAGPIAAAAPVQRWPWPWLPWAWSPWA